jgi:hypothetical protein
MASDRTFSWLATFARLRFCRRLLASGRSFVSLKRTPCAIQRGPRGVTAPLMCGEN